jgi:Ser/Thr protein kinase RdoA (MazF antagonist)
VSATSFAERMQDDPAVVTRHLICLAQLHRRIHAHPAPWLGSLVTRLRASIAGAPLLEEPHKQTLLRSLAAMPDGDRLCHGDFHQMNVLGDVAQPLVIDWPDACRGAPAADACRSYLLLRLHAADLAEPYLDAYCRVSGVQRDAILGWLPYVAAARLAEDVAGEVRALLQFARSSWCV